MIKFEKRKSMDITKQELHQLIDSCDNEILLEEAKQLLLSPLVKDWWDELAPEDKHLVMESEAQYQQSNFISHQQLMQEFGEWKKK